MFPAFTVIEAKPGTPVGSVVTVKVVLVAPAGMVIDAGSLTMFRPSLSLITICAPPAGAGIEIVTVAVELEPPLTVLGERVSETT